MLLLCAKSGPYSNHDSIRQQRFERDTHGGGWLPQRLDSKVVQELFVGGGHVLSTNGVWAIAVEPHLAHLVT